MGTGPDGQDEDEASAGARYLSEATEAGVQNLVPGIRPLRLADRLAYLASAPLVPTKPQRAADFGLFDLNARLQLDLFLQPESKRSEDEQAERGQLFASRPIEEQHS